MASSFIVSLTSLIYKPHSSRDWSIFMISIINFVMHEDKSKGRPNPNIFLWIACFVAGAAAVHPNGIKTLLGYGLGTFFIKGKTVFSNGPKSLSGNPPDCPII